MEKTIKETLFKILTGPKITTLALALTVIGVSTRRTELLDLNTSTIIIIIAFTIGIFGFIMSIVKSCRANNIQKRRLKIAGTIAIPFLGILAFVGSFVASDSYIANVNNPTITIRSSCKLYVDNVYQDEEMKSIILDKLGVHKNNIQGLEMRFVKNIDKNDTEALVDPLGTYHSDNLSSYAGDNCITEPPKIKVKNHLTGKERIRTVAHEFVHHYYSRPWFGRSIPEQDLILLYTKSQWMQNRTKDYIHDNSLALTEVLAYACTEMSDRELPENIIKTCNAILPNRHILELNN